MPRKPKAAFFCNDKTSFERVYGGGRKAMVESRAELYPEIITSENFAQHAAKLADIEAVFSTWGMPGLDLGQLAKLPALKAVFYAAGSVRGFAEPMLEKGVKVISAWAANAIPVAEFTLAQILLATKGYYRNIRDSKIPENRFGGKCHTGPGNFAEKVALLGAGQIGRKVVELLRPFALTVLVYDPFLSDADAAKLGVAKVSLEEAFSQALVVSNHVPNLPSTVGMMERKHFAAMRQGAVFINTGRGAQVKEEGLIAVLEERPDLTALLDVTLPEPPEKDSKFYTLPNVYLTNHIAGSLGNEVWRLADYALEEFDAWLAGKPLRFEVTKERYANMA